MLTIRILTNLLLPLLLAFSSSPGANAFAPKIDGVLALLPPWDKQQQQQQQQQQGNHIGAATTALWATPRGGGLFGRGGGNGFGPKKTPSSNKKKSKDEPDFSSATPLLEISADHIKVGPLRFLLQLFLSGDVMNRPAPKSWFVAQRDTSDGDGGDDKQSIEVYYQDGTGMISIELDSNSIVVNRVGARPSLVYQLQESVLLHSVLDELHKVAFEQPVDEHGRPTTTTPIDPSQRLLQLSSNEQAIEEARKRLPARAAPAPPSETTTSTQKKPTS